MSRRDRQRLEDVFTAIEAIRAHVTRGDLSDHEPDIPWHEVAAVRDRLAHRYFDTSHAILQSTVENDIPELEEAVVRLYWRLG